MKAQNYFLLVKVKPDDWKHKLVIPVPIFLVDEIIKAAPWVIKLWKKYAPDSYESTVEQCQELGIDMGAVQESLYELWRAIRRAGSFTIVDVKAEDTEVEVKFI